MEVLHSRCCGIDIHKRSITVCVLIREAGRKEQKHLREFATTTSEILNCADWLRSLGVTHVAMESTGVYWRPVWNLLEGQFDLLLANATHMRNVPGRKTDIKDSEWIAQLLPFDEAVSLLAEIPGFDRTTAWSVIAEIGIDMNQFPSADHLASWAGVCPGNNESGGKRLSGKTRKGSRWLRGQLLRPAQSGKTYSLFRQTANPTWPQSHLEPCSAAA
jgi:transposase